MIHGILHVRKKYPIIVSDVLSLVFIDLQKQIGPAKGDLASKMKPRYTLNTSSIALLNRQLALCLS